MRKGTSPHVPHPHHDHAGHPEEEDVVARLHHRGRDRSTSRSALLLRPAERGVRPEAGREPGIEHVFVLRSCSAEPHASQTSAVRPPQRSCGRTRCSTRRGYGAPTRAGGRCTSPGCSPSNSRRRARNARERCGCVRRCTAASAGSAIGCDPARTIASRLWVRPGRRCAGNGPPSASAAPLSPVVPLVPTARRSPCVPRSGRILRKAPASSFSVPSAFNTFTMARPCRSPVSKSLGSCPGVILSAPVPNSVATASSAMTGMSRAQHRQSAPACPDDSRVTLVRRDSPQPPCRRAASPDGSLRRSGSPEPSLV